jgi:hypothetical protein
MWRKVLCCYMAPWEFPFEIRQCGWCIIDTVHPFIGPCILESVQYTLFHSHLSFTARKIIVQDNHLILLIILLVRLRTPQIVHHIRTTSQQSPLLRLSSGWQAVCFLHESVLGYIMNYSQRSQVHYPIIIKSSRYLQLQPKPKSAKATRRQL